MTEQKPPTWSQHFDALNELMQITGGHLQASQRGMGADWRAHTTKLALLFAIRAYEAEQLAVPAEQRTLRAVYLALLRDTSRGLGMLRGAAEKVNLDAIGREQECLADTLKALAGTGEALKRALEAPPPEDAPTVALVA